MSNSPAFASTPNNNSISISTANTNRDGSGTITTLVTPGASGCKVQKVTIKATSSTTAGMIRFFRQVSSVYYLIKEIPVTAVTPSSTVQAWQYDWYCKDEDITLESGEILGVATNNAEAFAVSSFVGDY
jgi:hypothetical protein